MEKRNGITVVQQVYNGPVRGWTEGIPHITESWKRNRRIDARKFEEDR